MEVMNFIVGRLYRYGCHSPGAWTREYKCTGVGEHISFSTKSGWTGAYSLGAARRNFYESPSNKKIRRINGWK